MVVQSKRYSRFLFITGDALSIVFSVYLALWFRFFTGFHDEISGIENLDRYTLALWVVVPIYLFINFAVSLYKHEIEVDFFKEIGKIFISHMISIFVLMSLTFLTQAGMLFSRWVIVYFFIINVLLSIAMRGLIRFMLRQRYKNGAEHRIVVLGTGKLAQMYYENIRSYEVWGHKVIGFLTPEPGIVREIDREMLLGTFEDFLKLHEMYKFHEVVVALHIQEASYIEAIMRLCDMEGLRVKIIPGYYEHLQYSTYIEDLDGLPILTVRRIPLDLAFNRFLKRAFDILFSLFAICLAAPVMIVVAILVKITSSPGPVFFRQERVGLNNKSFTMLKFRSMRIQNPDKEKYGWSTEDDPRVTKFGSFLRRSSLDELPQFFNILAGQMSVVGPRPERPYWVQRFKEEIPSYMLRHYVKSGLTGWAQINGFRGDTSIEERIKYDNYYIQNWSLLFDIKIIWLTLFRAFH